MKNRQKDYFMNTDRLKFRTPVYDIFGNFIYFVYWVAGESKRPPLPRKLFLYKYGKDEQCIGLRDKNGNLIYDNDIVLVKYPHKSRSDKLIVKWGAGELSYNVSNGYYLFDFSQVTLETAKIGQDFPNSNEIKIIGSMHEQREQKD